MARNGFIIVNFVLTYLKFFFPSYGKLFFPSYWRFSRILQSAFLKIKHKPSVCNLSVSIYVRVILDG